MRKKHILSIFVVLIISDFMPCITHAEWVRVDRVIDGDTFITSDGKKVRIKNIDTPETNHPYKGKESGGEEAKKLAVFFLEGNYVWLNGKARDKYGRRLATVKLRGGKSYSDIVRSHGFDKKTNSIYSSSNSSRYNLGGRSSKPKSLNPFAYSSLEMTRYKVHKKKAGSSFTSHWRPKSTLNRSNLSPEKKPRYYKTAKNNKSESSESLDCGNDKILVKGYYRKNGIYVRPHCRKITHKR